MSKNFLLFFLSGCLQAALLFAQSPEELIAEGNAAYERNAFDEAERSYKEAIAKDAAHHWPQAIYNLGNALYQQKKFDEAKKQFEAIEKAAVSNDLKSASWYNLGNCHLEQKNYAAAIAAYKTVLKLNPRDENARYNLSYAMAILNKSQIPSKQSTTQREKQPDDMTIPPLSPEEQEKLLKEIEASETQTTKNLKKEVRQRSLKKDW